MAQIFYIGWRTHDGDNRPIEADVYVEVRDERGETWRGQAGLSDGTLIRDFQI